MISSSKIAIFQWGFTSQLISLLTPLCGAWTGGRNQLELPKQLICLILQDVIRVNNWGISNCFCLGISYQELFGIISRIMWYKIMPWRFPNNFRWFPSISQISSWRLPPVTTTKAQIGWARVEQDLQKFYLTYILKDSIIWNYMWYAYIIYKYKYYYVYIELRVYIYMFKVCI